MLQIAVFYPFVLLETNVPASLGCEVRICGRGWGH